MATRKSLNRRNRLAFFIGLFCVTSMAPTLGQEVTGEPKIQIPETEVQVAPLSPGTPPVVVPEPMQNRDPQIGSTPIEPVVIDEFPADQPDVTAPAVVPTDPLSNPSPSRSAPPRPAATSPSVLRSNSFAAAIADGYRAEESTVGSLIPLTDLELPASTSVVTSETLTDQQVLRITETLRNIPAAIAVGDGLYGDRFFLRGLEVRSRDFRKNGFLDPTFTPRDFANVERVEILKGPASVLYGSAGPAGTVNVVTKKPVDASFTNYDYQFGSYGLNRSQLDTNGRLSGDGSMLYRFNGAYEDSGSFRDFGYSERYQVAPSTRWFIDDDTMLTAEAEFVENKRRGDVGISSIGGNVLALPRDRYLGEPGSDQFHTRDNRASVMLDHRFDDDWAVQVGTSTVFYDIDATQSLPVGEFGGQIFRLRQNYTGSEQASSIIANLTGRFETGSLDHRFVMGTEQAYYDADTSIGALNLNPINSANPVYTNPTPGAPVFFADFPVFRQVRHGYYMQDFITVNKHWQLLGGVRFDDVDLTYDRNLGFGPTRTEQRFMQTTPRVGIVYQPLPETLSTYFNYSRSFNPPGGGGFPFLNQPVRAEQGELYEAGIKTLLTENLVFHVAGFHVERQNVPFADFGAFGPIFTQLGQERSQGAEVELLGRITDDWNVIANYAYVDTKLTDPTNAALFGQRSRNIPLNQWSMWSRYDLLKDCCRSLGVAGGVTYVGDRTANRAANVGLPSYTRWDMGLYGSRGRWDSSLFVENLFDAYYAQSSINEFQVMPGAPASVRCQIGARF